MRWTAHALAVLSRPALGLLGVLGGAALVAAAIAGGPWAFAGVVVGCAIVFASIAIVAEPVDRSFLLVVVLALLLVRYTSTMLFDVVTVARTGGHVWAPDEGLYLRLAGQIADHWRDPAAYVDWTDGNVQSQYVQTIARIFLVIGTNVPVVKIMNVTLAVVVSVLAYRTMVNLAMLGRRASVLLLLTFPSLMLWSGLALKDAYVWAFCAAVVWSSSEYVRSRNPWWHVVTLLMLLPLESVRRYIFVTMAIAWVFVVLAVSGRERLRAGAVTVSALAGILIIANPLRDMGINPLYTPIVIRESAAIGGRTSFVEPPPVVRGRPGDRVTIRSNEQTPDPNATPREVLARPGDVIVFESSLRPDVTRPPNAVVVRPGDVVVFATPTPGATPMTTPKATAAAASPSTTPLVVVLDPDAVNKVGEPYSVESDDLSVQRTLGENLGHLPVGLAFVLGAPFPWMLRTMTDLAALPELIFWYTALGLAALGGIQLVVRRDFRYAHGAAALAGMILILALILGNVGTLIRSRDMAILFVCVLAGVGAAEVTARWPRLVPARIRRIVLDPGPA